jgi:hypothetical protein
MKRLESEIEQRAIRRLRARLGCLPLKTSEPLRHYPDRMVLLKGGKIVWVEFKRPGEHQTAAQKYIASELRTLGFDVYTVSSEAELDDLLAFILEKEQNDDE